MTHSWRVCWSLCFAVALIWRQKPRVKSRLNKIGLSISRVFLTIAESTVPIDTNHRFVTCMFGKVNEYEIFHVETFVLSQ